MKPIRIIKSQWYKYRFKKTHKLTNNWFLNDYFNEQQKIEIKKMRDPVRYGTILLAKEQIEEEKIEGDFAECGVYRGATSTFLVKHFPDRQLFLFDTFQGFDLKDSDSLNDNRFKDTSVEGVLKRIGNTSNVVVKQGYFPETAAGLEDKRFAFVMIDFDKYEPTLAALKFFYPRVVQGGFIFVHDYNNPESNKACSRAFKEFAQTISEKIIAIPDSWGTAFIRKI